MDCGTTGPSPITKTFSGSVFDGPPGSPDTLTGAAPPYFIPVSISGYVGGTLRWEHPRSPQPAGAASLDLDVEAADGMKPSITITSGDVPNGFEFVLPVTPQTYRVMVRPAFRTRVGFYCLCTVPYTLTLTWR